MGIVALLLLTGPAPAQPARPILIENVEIRAMDGSPNRIGAILIRGSRITAVGENVERPRFARRIDGVGLVATPGLIDVQSALGLTDLSSSGGDATAIAADSFDRYDTAGIEDVLRQGVTTVHIAPAGRAGITGRSSIIRLTRDGDRAIGTVYREAAALCINLESSAPPIDRLQLFDRLRRQFRAARQYKDTLEAYEEELEEYEKQIAEAATKDKEGDAESPARDSHGGRARGAAAADADVDTQVPPRRRPGRPPRRPGGDTPSDRSGEEDGKNGDGPKKPERPAPNRGHDVLLQAMAQELPVRLRAHRSEDLLNALELADEFGLRLILEGAADAHLVAKAIARQTSPQGHRDNRTRAQGRSVAVVIEPAEPGRANPPDDQRRRSPQQASILADLDIAWMVGSGGTVPSTSRFTLLRAQTIVQQSGVDVDPLELVTARAAHLLGVERDLGRLAPDALADIVLWSGDPLDPASQVVRVIVGGQTVYASNDNAATRLPDASEAFE